VKSPATTGSTKDLGAGGGLVPFLSRFSFPLLVGARSDEMHGLALDQILPDRPVALHDRYGAVTEDCLQGGQRATCVSSLRREGVPA
jgi:hypothetical protein